MQKHPVRTRPTYLPESVDHALVLIELLRDTGSLRVSEAAVELGVAPSTAHRLLSALVYRGFATQDESRRYLPGPAVGLGPAKQRWTRELRSLVSPYLEALSYRLDETTNLLVRIGTKVRFLSTAEGSQALRVGDRQGFALPAHRASAGRAILAELPWPTVRHLFTGAAAELAGDRLDEDGLQHLRTQLDDARERRYAINVDGTEEGVSAIGIALHDSRGTAIAGLTVTVPTRRFEAVHTPRTLRSVMEVGRSIDGELRQAGLTADD